MTTYFLKRANEFDMTDQSAINLHEKLPPAVYLLCAAPERGLFLREVSDFEPPPPKIYGNCLRYVDRIINTFQSRKGKNTGVLLSGQKGSGKTLCARETARKCVEEHGMPVVLINSPYRGDSFNDFIGRIEQPCVLLFDEFEKVYDEKEAQEGILTLLDGVFAGSKLWLFTSNAINVSYYMMNRPGRIFYAIEYDGMDEEFVVEFVKDNLIHADRVDEVIRITKIIPKFNVDMLRALVEEVNRYNEPLKQTLDILNVKMDGYKITLKISEVEILRGKEKGHRYEFKEHDARFDPYSDHWNLSIDDFWKDDGEEDYDDIYLSLSPSTLVQVDHDDGLFVWEVEVGQHRIRIKGRKHYTPSGYDWSQDI